MFPVECVQRSVIKNGRRDRKASYNRKYGKLKITEKIYTYDFVFVKNWAAV